MRIIWIPSCVHVPKKGMKSCTWSSFFSPCTHGSYLHISLWITPPKLKPASLSSAASCELAAFHQGKPAKHSLCPTSPIVLYRPDTSHLIPRPAVHLLISKDINWPTRCWTSSSWPKRWTKHPDLIITHSSVFSTVCVFQLHQVCVVVTCTPAPRLKWHFPARWANSVSFVTLWLCWKVSALCHDHKKFILTISGG